MKLGIGLGPCYSQHPAAAEVFDPYSEGFFLYFWNWNVDNNEERVFQDNGSTLVNDTEQPVQLWRERINNGELGLASETAPQSDSNGAVFGYDATLYNADGLTHDDTQNFLLMWRMVIIDDDVSSSLFTFMHQGEGQESTYYIYYDYTGPNLIGYLGSETNVVAGDIPVGQPLYCYFSRITQGEDMVNTIAYSVDFGSTWVAGNQVFGPGLDSDLGCYVGLTGNSNNSKISSIGYGVPTEEAAAAAQIAGVSQYWKATYDTGG